MVIMSEELDVMIINNEPFYKISNGTSYDYAPIPKEFKPYFERLQKENKLLKERIEYLERSIARKEDTIVGYIHETVELDKYKEVIEEISEELKYIDDDIMATCENYDVNGIPLKKILDKVGD